MKEVKDNNYNNHMQRYVFNKYKLGYGLRVLDLLELFPCFEETIEPYSFLGGSSTIIDLALLKKLGRRYDYCRYLEIGTWRGESVSNMVGVADDIVSIDLTKETLKKKGVSNRYILNQRVISKKYDNIKYYNHDSKTFDYTIFKDGFDLIFVDGDHTYESIKKDTQNVFKLIRDENSIIVWHDYGFNPERIQWGVLAAILDGAPFEYHDNIYHVSNSLCAIFIKGKFNAEYKDVPHMPNKLFTVNIEVKR